MQRDRIVDFGADLAIGQELAKFVATLGSNHVLVVHVMGMRRSGEHADGRISGRGDQPRLRQQQIIGSGMFAALPVPGLEMGKFHAQDRRLDCIQPAIPAQLFMAITLRASMIAQAPHVIGKFSMVGCDQSRVSVGAQIFGRIETEGGERADGSGARIAPAGSDRLRGVFHDGHLELVC